MESKSKKPSILKYRSFIMGIATMSILFYHIPLSVENSFFNSIKSIGYSGVDLFVFCSGWGCSMSLMKNKKIYEFWKRRAMRVLPVWIPFLIVFWTPFFLFIKKDRDISVYMTVVGNILGVQAFTEKGNVFCWYISFLLVSYLLVPFLVRFTYKKEAFYCVLLIILFIVLPFPFWNTKSLILIFSRLSLFYIAIVLQKYWKKIRSKNTIIGMGLAMIVGYVGVWIILVSIYSDCARFST